MLKTIKLALALLALGAFTGPVLATEKPDAPMEIAGATTVDADGVIALLDEHPDLIILDNRKESDFNAGSIEGAVRLIDTEVTPDSLSAAIPAKDAAVLMYCNGIKCGRAANAVQKAVEAGYTKIYYYALGLAEWKDKGLPLVTN